jgi:hypothetical protein
MLDGMVGKNLKIVYNDGEAISVKVGLVESVDATFVYFFSNGRSQAIALAAIVRFEEVRI